MLIFKTVPQIKIKRFNTAIKVDILVFFPITLKILYIETAASQLDVITKFWEYNTLYGKLEKGNFDLKHS